eukprot:4666340-Amphidinium_carterae.1
MTVVTASGSTSLGWFLTAVAPSAVVGFALAPLFPGAMLVAEELLGRAVSGTAASVMVSAAATGEMLLPMITGSLMSLKPMMFCWVQLTLCFAASTMFCILLRSKNTSARCCMRQPLLGKEPDASGDTCH